MTRYKRILLKISGEALSVSGSGINNEGVSAVAEQIKRITETGVELGMVVGGGNLWRGRSSEQMDRSVADHIGMLATVMNGLALSEALKACGVDCRVVSSFTIDKICEPYYLPKVLEYMTSGKVVIFVGGTGLPYFSTDTALSLRACETHADAVFYLKNIDGIYDSDPKTNPKAKKYDEITFDKVISDNLKAMDLTAMAMCREYGLKVVALSKDEPDSVLRVLNGEKLGTTIK